MIKPSVRRGLVRCIHLALAAPILGYIYSPFAVLPDYAPLTRYVFVPAIALSGLWMWKGHVVRRWIGPTPGPHEGMPAKG